MSTASQEFPIYESGSANIKNAAVFRELPIMRPARKVSERIRHWHYLADTPVEEIKGKVLVLIGSGILEAHWIL